MAIARTLAAAAGVLLLAAGSNAGPIEWTYKVTQGTVNGSPHLLYGEGWAYIRGVDGNPPTDYEAQVAYGLASGVLTGGRSGPTRAAFYEEGGGVLLQEPLTRRVFSANTLSPSGYDTRWRVTAEITDVASGETGVAEFLWAVEPRTEFGPDLDMYGFVLGNPLSSQDGPPLLLGGNRYQLRANNFQAGSSDFQVLNVSITPVVETPEPASLALAGLGLAAAAWRRYRLSEPEA